MEDQSSRARANTGALPASSCRIRPFRCRFAETAPQNTANGDPPTHWTIPFSDGTLFGQGGPLGGVAFGATNEGGRCRRRGGSPWGV
jgi:hypothetical protein